MPTGGGGYSYGRALANQGRRIQDLGLQQAIGQTLGQADIDLAKDQARRRYLAGRANTAQMLEDMRGRNVGTFMNLLTQGIGAATAPIRPGGDKYGDFKAALEGAGENMKNRNQFINQFAQEQGRLPGMDDFQAFQQNPGYLGY